MERLKIVLFIAGMVATAQTSPGQEQVQNAAMSPASPQSTYVVIGDVRNCNYFALSTATTIREAVLKAGLLSESANVSVLRGTQDRALWTQQLSATSVDSGEPVMKGDVLVVQAMQPVTESLQKNAALRTDDGVVVVALKDDSIAVGDVLQQTQNPASPDHQLRITCRFQGHQPLVSASLSDRVFHGDIITSTRGGRQTLQGFGGMLPAVSDWKYGAIAAEVIAPDSLAATHYKSPSPEERQPLLNPSLQIPFESSPPKVEPAEPVSELLRPTTHSVESEKVHVQVVSQINPLSLTARPEAAPASPIEVSITDEPAPQFSTDSANSWNLFFIGALLISGVLILAGSLRPDEEDLVNRNHQKEQSSAHAASSQASAVVAASSTLQDQGHEFITPHSGAELKELSKEQNIPVAQDSPIGCAVQQFAIAPTGLVGLHEWFGDDWRTVHSKTNAPESVAPSPILVGELESNQQHSGSFAGKQQPLESVTRIAALPSPAMPADNDVLTERNIESAKAVGTPGTASPHPEELLSEEMSLSDSITVSRHMEENSDLEDLLQNRLPVDLCSTELPLKMALFGRAAGPRRLRIDAAHSKISGPHMNLTPGKRREESGEGSAARIAADSKVNAAAGSLDKALHQLQDRNE